MIRRDESTRAVREHGRRPVLGAVCVALGGTDATGAVRWWAFTIAPARSVVADVVVVTLVVVAASTAASGRVRARSAATTGEGDAHRSW